MYPNWCFSHKKYSSFGVVFLGKYVINHVMNFKKCFFLGENDTRVLLRIFLLN